MAPGPSAPPDSRPTSSLAPLPQPPGSARAPRRADQEPTLKVPPPGLASLEGRYDRLGAASARDVRQREADIAWLREHRRTGMGTLARTGILAALAAVTVVAPLTSYSGLGASATTVGPAQARASARASSVAAAVLGSDADIDSSTDNSMNNVPDAATLARIRDAYANAKATCTAPAPGASGEMAAFSPAPSLVYPMAEGTYTLSSPYGYRLHPTLGVLKLHAGMDMSAPAGTPIYAAAAGTVVEAGMVDGTGTVTIQHEIDGKTWYTSYLHMYEDGIYVKVGDKVKVGQLIAGAGSTGYSTGPHLHFEVRTANDTSDETTVDPAAWLVEHKAAQLTTDCL